MTLFHFPEDLFGDNLTLSLCLRDTERWCPGLKIAKDIKPCPVHCSCRELVLFPGPGGIIIKDTVSVLKKLYIWWERHQLIRKITSKTNKMSFIKC